MKAVPGRGSTGRPVAATYVLTSHCGGPPVTPVCVTVTPGSGGARLKVTGMPSPTGFPRASEINDAISVVSVPSPLSPARSAISSMLANAASGVGVALSTAVGDAVGVMLRVGVRVRVGVSVRVTVDGGDGVMLGVGERVTVSVRDAVGVPLKVGVRVRVADGVPVRVAVAVWVLVRVLVNRGLAVAVFGGVSVSVAVAVRVATRVRVCVAVAVSVCAPAVTATAHTPSTAPSRALLTRFPRFAMTV